MIINILDDLVETLEEKGYVLGESYFFFPYDWRLDLGKSDDLLKQRVEQVKRLTGASEVDIIAHSMGGLLAKSYIDKFGDSDIAKLVFVGTPHLGAPKSAKVILYGDRLSIPWLEENRIQEVARNSSAIYQLLPSQKYFDKFQGYLAPFRFFSRQLLDYQGTKDFLAGRGVNQFLLNKAEQFFDKNLAEMDFGNIDVYNIAGCRRATQAAYRFTLGNSGIGSIGYTSGDGTVPLPSANFISLPSFRKFYVKDASHVELPSHSSVRELILGILSEDISLANEVSNSSAFCKFRGKRLTWRSPLEVHIYDQNGNHVGPTADNSIEYGIDGIDYEVINGEKFVFLPTDKLESYRVEGPAEADGVFDLLVAEIDDGAVLNTAVFNDALISQDSVVSFQVSSSGLDVINVDVDGDGQFVEVEADSILEGDQAEDLVPPVTNVIIDGTAGANGWYRSGVSVTLEAVDEGTGILETKYSLDEGRTFQQYLEPIILEDDGVVNLVLFSADRAGNNEDLQTLIIKIDQTAPELDTRYSLDLEEFTFESIDSLDSNPSIICIENMCELQNGAGNVSKVIFKFKDKKNKDGLEIESISYNSGQVIMFPKNHFKVKFKKKKGELKDFDQSIDIKQKEKVEIKYNHKRNGSVIETKSNPEKKIKETVDGLRFLQLSTSRGILEIEIIK